MNPNDLPINTIKRSSYMKDDGCTFTQLDLEEYIDYTNLNFISTSPPKLRRIQDLVDHYEFETVEYADGNTGTKILYLLYTPIYMRLGASEYMDVNFFTVDVPMGKFNKTIFF
jgi:hypothetical protein